MINKIKQALEACSALINYQFTGSSESMNALQHADNLVQEALASLQAQESGEDARPIDEFSKHELLDRVSCLNHMMDDWVASHPAASLVSEAVSKAGEALADLYQAAGAMRFDDAAPSKPQGDSKPTGQEPRFYIDHDTIHDRKTGKHVHGDRGFEIGIADESLAMLNELDRAATQPTIDSRKEVVAIFDTAISVARERESTVIHGDPEKYDAYSCVLSDLRNQLLALCRCDAPAQEKMSDEEIAAIYKRTFEGMPDCARSAPTNLPPLIFAFARAVRGEEEDK